MRHRSPPSLPCIGPTLPELPRRYGSFGGQFDRFPVSVWNMRRGFHLRDGSRVRFMMTADASIVALTTSKTAFTTAFECCFQVTHDRISVDKGKPRHPCCSKNAFDDGQESPSSVCGAHRSNLDNSAFPRLRLIRLYTDNIRKSLAFYDLLASWAQTLNLVVILPNHTKGFRSPEVTSATTAMSHATASVAR